MPDGTLRRAFFKGVTWLAYLCRVLRTLFPIFLAFSAIFLYSIETPSNPAPLLLLAKKRNLSTKKCLKN